jgi:hypothetical protein
VAQRPGQQQASADPIALTEDAIPHGCVFSTETSTAETVEVTIKAGSKNLRIK